MEKVKNHTFVICAYKENKFLENCIQSLIDQTVQSEIIICTSTPNNHISQLAQKYNLKMFINTNKSSLSGDWNFAIQSVNTEYFTICHQDDYYYDKYLENVMHQIEKVDKCIFVYTNYVEHKNSGICYTNLNMKIKNILNYMMRFKFFRSNVFLRRRVLSLGNPICCPSVTYNKSYINDNFFDVNFKNAADWDAWERLSRKNGHIIYVPEQLMAHRIYEESTTSQNIKDNTRSNEDLIIFKRFWPSFIAKPLARLFQLSEKNNE